MKTLILTTTTAVALIFANTDAAQAGSKFQLVIGGGGYGGGYVNPGFGGGYGGGGFNNPGYVGGGFNNPGFGGGFHDDGHLHHDVNPHVNPGFGGHYDWHDTTHYDYIPGRWVKHGCHWHYIPGRRVLHRDGHWDLHHH